MQKKVTEKEEITTLLIKAFSMLSELKYHQFNVLRVIQHNISFVRSYMLLTISKHLRQKPKGISNFIRFLISSNVS